MAANLNPGAATAARPAPPGDHFPTPGRRGRGDWRWQDDALCAALGSWLWEDPDQVGMAQHMCMRHCPVKPECQKWARGHRWHECVVGGDHYRPPHGTPTAKPVATLASQLYAARLACEVCQNPEA